MLIRIYINKLLGKQKSTDSPKQKDLNTKVLGLTSSRQNNFNE